MLRQHCSRFNMDGKRIKLFLKTWTERERERSCTSLRSCPHTLGNYSIKISFMGSTVIVTIPVAIKMCQSSLKNRQSVQLKNLKITWKYVQIEIANVWTRPWRERERELEIHVLEKGYNLVHVVVPRSSECNLISVNWRWCRFAPTWIRSNLIRRHNTINNLGQRSQLAVSWFPAW